MSEEDDADILKRKNYRHSVTNMYLSIVSYHLNLEMSLRSKFRGHERITILGTKSLIYSSYYKNLLIKCLCVVLLHKVLYFFALIILEIKMAQHHTIT